MCQTCAQGQWQPQQGQDSCRQAARCTGDEFELRAPTSTTDRICASRSGCSTQHYVSKPRTAGRVECSQCPPGHRCDGTDAVACAVGRFANGFVERDATECEACSPGTFAPTTARSQCFRCPKGYYQEAAAQHGCKGCAKGMYAANAGMYHCYNCPAGRFAPAPQATKCAAAPVISSP